jgi:hypothetical protein
MSDAHAHAPAHAYAQAQPSPADEGQKDCMHDIPIPSPLQETPRPPACRRRSHASIQSLSLLCSALPAFPDIILHSQYIFYSPVLVPCCHFA